MEEDILREFLVETYENLHQLDADLLALEKDPNSRAVLDNIFRIFHSCKGACGFLGLAKLESVAHSGENLLGLIRDRKVEMNSAITDALLRTVDTVRKILANVEASHCEGAEDHSALVSMLDSFHAENAAGGRNQPSVKNAQSSYECDDDPVVRAIKSLDPGRQEEFKDIIADIMIKKGSLMSEDIDAALQQCSAHRGGPDAAASVQPEAAEKRFDDQKGHAAADMSIRVNIGILDRLMNLVGELVLVRNQFLRQTAVTEDSEYISISQRLNLITSELQEGIMKTRMQPINNIWRNFPRIVREMASSLNKKVRLEMEGKETELDKTVIESIKDPLTHIIRNSIDHGIEDPSTRASRKKREEGMLLLRAFHEGGQVNIEIIDDGNGIDTAKVKQKAIQRGLITAAQASVMSEREILNLIFLSGFSTAEKVTNISGRGVGMDVVRKNIEKIGGTVDIENRFGAGTSVKIKIPLTLAIIPALIVICGGDHFAIPQISLLEVVRLKGPAAKKGIEEIRGARVYRLRGKLLPLIYLNEELKISSSVKSFDEINQDDYSVNIIVLQAGDRQFGLIVDGVSDTEEIVVKPLDKRLKNISVFAGATIRGDGRVALILDILGLAKASGVVSELNENALIEKSRTEKSASKNFIKLLLFMNFDGGRMAIDLSKVSRLENFSASEIEQTGDFDVVQYRGRIMPLVYISKILPERRRESRHPVKAAAGRDGNIKVVVYSNYDECFGIVVDSIIDIIETDIDIQRSTAREGVSGSSVIHNKVTEILDMEYIIKKIKGKSLYAEESFSSGRDGEITIKEIN